MQYVSLALLPLAARASIAGQVELFGSSGADVDFYNLWSGWYTQGGHRTGSDGKTRAYDNMGLTSFQLESDDGARVSVDLAGTAYEGMTMLQIIQSTGLNSNSENDDTGSWPLGHITLPIDTANSNAGGHAMGSTLRIGVGDGTSDRRDWALFCAFDDNARGDFHGVGAYSWGSETRTNPGYRSGRVTIYGVSNNAIVDCPSGWSYDSADERCVPKSSLYSLTCRANDFDLQLHYDIYQTDFAVGSCVASYNGQTGMGSWTFNFAACGATKTTDANGLAINDLVAEPTSGLHANYQIFPSINIHCEHQAFTAMTFQLDFFYDSQVKDDLLEGASGNIKTIVSIHSDTVEYMVGSTVSFYIESNQRVDDFTLTLLSCHVHSNHASNPTPANIFDAQINDHLDVTVNTQDYATTAPSLTSPIFTGAHLWDVTYKGFKYVAEADQFHHTVICALQVSQAQGTQGVVQG